MYGDIQPEILQMWWMITPLCFNIISEKELTTITFDYQRVLIFYLSQVLSLQIFWPLTLNFSPSGAKPNVKFLWIFENHSHVGLLSLLQVKHSMFVQPSLLRTVSKSLTVLVPKSIWKCGILSFVQQVFVAWCLLARHCASPYVWIGQGLVGLFLPVNLDVMFLLM